MAQALGKEYQAAPRSADGELFEKIDIGLGRIGLCTPCAQNVADEYVKHPSGEIAKLADAALSGDVQALQQLENGDYSQPIADSTPPSENQPRIDPNKRSSQAEPSPLNTSVAQKHLTSLDFAVIVFTLAAVFGIAA